MTDTSVENKEDPPQKDEELAERHGFVDLDEIEDPELRKKIAGRLNGLYHSNKDTMAAMAETRNLNAAMERRLADFEAKEVQKVDNAKLAEVRKGIVEANSKGDYEKAAVYQEQMVDLKAPKAAPVKQQDDALEERHTQMLFAWQSEMTDDGRMARPWAHKTHRGYQETIAHLTEVTEDPSFRGKEFGAILAEVDRRMTPKPKQAAPVSDGDATPSRPSGKTVQLTEGEKKAAVRLYPSMKPVEAIKRYAEARKKYGDT